MGKMGKLKKRRDYRFDPRRNIFCSCIIPKAEVAVRELCSGDATDLARRMDMPLCKIYGVLESLRVRRIIEIKPEYPYQWSIISH